jgi:membrane protease YdiL (CAAX protease family)
MSASSRGFFEELIFRAIVLRLLMRAFGIWPALALSAALFGALHLANPNATPAAAIAIAVEAGLMLASFYC